jgi:hypothetical protein
LSSKDQAELLRQVEAEVNRRFILLEKDIWVVWSLHALFDAPFAEALTFKGGTSLSKAYGHIQRFSEDVDVTYSLRAIAQDLIDANGGNDYPTSRSQQGKWTDKIRARLKERIVTEIQPYLAGKLQSEGLNASLVVSEDQIELKYPTLDAPESVASPSPYLTRAVKLEFGARSTGEPYELRRIICDAYSRDRDVTFPEVEARVMLAERTFWEKATAMHVYCHQGRVRGANHFSRHYHDVSRLNRAGVVVAACENPTFAKSVAEHKSTFFREKADDGNWIDYYAATRGGLQLVPRQDDPLQALSDDYQSMLGEGLLPENTESFEVLMDDCQEVENAVNSTCRRAAGS